MVKIKRDLFLLSDDMRRKGKSYIAEKTFAIRGLFCDT